MLWCDNEVISCVGPRPSAPCRTHLRLRKSCDDHDDDDDGEEEDRIFLFFCECGQGFVGQSGLLLWLVVFDHFRSHSVKTSQFFTDNFSHERVRRDRLVFSRQGPGAAEPDFTGLAPVTHSSSGTKHRLKAALQRSSFFLFAFLPFFPLSRRVIDANRSEVFIPAKYSLSCAASPSPLCPGFIDTKAKTPRLTLGVLDAIVRLQPELLF